MGTCKLLAAQFLSIHGLTRTDPIATYVCPCISCIYIYTHTHTNIQKHVTSTMRSCFYICFDYMDSDSGKRIARTQRESHTGGVAWLQAIAKHLVRYSFECKVLSQCRRWRSSWQLNSDSGKSIAQELRLRLRVRSECCTRTRKDICHESKYEGKLCKEWIKYSFECKVLAQLKLLTTS